MQAPILDSRMTAMTATMVAIPEGKVLSRLLPSFLIP